jgi:hypothetical protein
MSFPPMQPHLEMRTKLIDLYPPPAFYEAEMDVHRTKYPSDTSGFAAFSTSGGPSQAQLVNIAANSSEAQFAPLTQTQQREAGGSFNMGPFIDATKKVGPTSFGVLKIRNVSP